MWTYAKFDLYMFMLFTNIEPYNKCTVNKRPRVGMKFKTLVVFFVRKKYRGVNNACILLKFKSVELTIASKWF